MMRDHDTGPTAGQTLPGGLRILDPMGSTPEGTLYHAEYPDGREVALLLAAPGSSEVTASRRERLERAIQIQHVNVARIYAAGELGNGSLYVVLEKLGGEPLSKLAAGRVFSLPEALDLALQVAAGLRAAHRAGFVHGNLSPDTILVTEAGDGLAQIKLIGFELYPSPGQAGIALPVRTEASEYASPERLAGDPPDDRSDVFSLGAILHHLLTGMPPDSGEVDGSVPRVARDVLGAAMASPPVRRFHTIPEFHAALERLAGLTGRRSVPGRRRALKRGAVGATLAALIAGVSLIPRAESPSPTEQQPVARGAHPASAGSIGVATRLSLTPGYTAPPKESVEKHPFSGCGALRSRAASRASGNQSSRGRRTRRRPPNSDWCGANTSAAAAGAAYHRRSGAGLPPHRIGCGAAATRRPGPRDRRDVAVGPGVGTEPGAAIHRYGAAGGPVGVHGAE